MVEVIKMELRLEKFSDYPTQYTAFAEHVHVAYLRVKHGEFTVTCPDVGGEQVYQAWIGDGGHLPEHGEAHYLAEAKLAILTWMIRNGVKWPTA